MEYIADRSVRLYFGCSSRPSAKVVGRGPARIEPRRRPEYAGPRRCRLPRHVRDLRHRVARRRAPPTRARLAADDATPRPPRARTATGIVRRGPVGAGGAPALDHRPRGRRPADRQRGRQRRRRPERRDLQLPRAARRARAAAATASRTDSDTEVLVHLYEEHGTRFVERLRGMFAFALWDARRAAPAAGARPLRDQAALLPASPTATLSFASELKALLEQPGFSREVDLEALAAFLAFNSIPAPLTIFAAARKLPPGHLLAGEDGRGRESSATRGPARSPAERGARRGRRTSSPRSCASGCATRSAPTSSPTSRSASSCPAASTRGAGRARRRRERRARCRRSRSASRRAASTSSTRARLVAERYGTDHHELVVRPDAVELLPKLVEAFDEPFADSSAIPTYLVSELAAGR